MTWHMGCEMPTPAHLILIDSSGFAYRAYHGGSKFPRYRSDGMPTGTVIAFLEMIYRLQGEASADPASHIAAVFDVHGGRTFRNDLFREYKGNRTQRDPELTLQLPVMRDAARALGITPVEVPGFEADDVIATLAHRGVAAGLRVTIVSSDKDFAQLVQDGKKEIVDPLKGKRVLERHVVEKFGVPPRLVADLQALAGDTADNIPGADGIGIDTAGKLIRKIGNLDAVLAEAEKKVGYRMTASAKLSINKDRERLKIFQRLTTLVLDVPLPVGLDDLVVVPMKIAHLKELLKALEADALFDRIFNRRPGELPAPVARLPAGSELQWHAAAVVEAAKKLKSPSYRITLSMPDVPQVGWYKRRLVKMGPWVPARIWRERAIDFSTDRPGDKDELKCEVGGAIRNAFEQWGILLNNPVSKADFDFMMLHREWVQKYAPNEPEADEAKPIDWDKVPI